MKNKLMLIPVLLLIAAMVTGCGPKNNGTSDPGNGKKPVAVETQKPEEAAKAVVDALYGDVKNNDLKDFDTYFVDDEELENEFNETLGVLSDMDALLDAFNGEVGELAEFIDQTHLEKEAKAFADEICGSIDYTIESVELNDDETSADVTVTVKVPNFDFENIDMDETAMADMMTEAFGFDMNDPMALMEVWAEKKGMTVDELTVEIASATDPEAMTAEILSDFSDEFNTFISLMFDTLIDNIDTTDVEETEEVITVEKQDDGSWKITAMPQ